jgi:DNA-binding response OmpR family regulator
METKPILIVAAEEDLPFYADLQLDDENLLFQSPRQVLDNIDHLEADLILLDAGTPPEVGLDLLLKIKPKSLAYQSFF